MVIEYLGGIILWNWSLTRLRYHESSKQQDVPKMILSLCFDHLIYLSIYLFTMDIVTSIIQLKTFYSSCNITVGWPINASIIIHLDIMIAQIIKSHFDKTKMVI